tara:strand:- start:3188 stop:4276 length:1089 start_codon:yes stop_codon:yes gene_type:complete
VLGAGCGGQTFAGHLAMLGYDVNLYNRSPERLGQLVTNPVINLKGAINGTGKLNTATTNIEEAVEGSEIILVVTTATGHRSIAKAVTPYLKDGQAIILNPGRTFGSLEFANEVYSQRPELDVDIVEANTLIYATRVTEPGRAQVCGVKEEVAVSALRPERTRRVIEKMQPHFPQLREAQNILETSMGNIGAVFHPTIMLLNYERVIGEKDFMFYTEGVTPEVATFLEQVDRERQNVAEALGTQVPSISEWLKTRYNLEGDSLRTLMTTNPAYATITAPNSMNHRYIFEDVPTGLVPISLVGEALGIKTPSIDYLLQQSENLFNYDFVRNGRNLKRLGLTSTGLRDELSGFVQRELDVVGAYR